MKYINRSDDFTQIIKSILKTDITFLLAGEAFGATSFMKELSNKFFERRYFYINSTTNSSLSANLISEIIRSDLRNDFKEFINNELGEKSTSLISAIFQGIPYAGPVISNLLERKEAPSIYTGNFTTAIEEVLIPYFTLLAKKSDILITIDAAQVLDEESYNTIANIACINEVHIVLCITDIKSYSYIKLKNELSLYSQITSNTMSFGQPDEKLIRELANYYGYSLSQSNIKEIMISSHKNIHLIIENILNLSHKEPLKFNAIDKAIVSLLNICNYGLQHQDIVELLKMSTVFSTDIAVDSKKTLTKLINYNCISCKHYNEGTYYILSSMYHPEIEKCLISFADMLYYKSIVYDYYIVNTQMENVQVITLMYSLSMELSQPKTTEYALKLLEYKLQNSELISDNIVANAHLSKKTNHEIELAVLYYTRERKYSIALSWLKSFKGSKFKQKYQYLHAILLNRTRDMTLADNLLSEYILHDNKPQITNILLAYFTANCIHTNQSHKAIKEYHKRVKTLEDTRNWGYFLRNLASAYNFPEKSDFYSKAIENFKLYNDDYGIYSTECNLGNSLCCVGQANEALTHLKTAEKGLQQFGVHHLHIIYNNLGICYLLLGDLTSSNKYLTLAEKIAYNKMPKLLTTINKACLLVAENRFSEAQHLLKQLKEAVDSHPVVSVRCKYYINRLFVEYQNSYNEYLVFRNTNNDILSKYLTKKHIAIYASLTGRKIEYLSDLWKALYFPAGLAYWYLDPLKLI